MYTSVSDKRAAYVPRVDVTTQQIITSTHIAINSSSLISVYIITSVSLHIYCVV